MSFSPNPSANSVAIERGRAGEYLQLQALAWSFAFQCEVMYETLDQRSES